MAVDLEKGVVEAVSRRPAHGIAKHPADAIHLLAGQGVEGDAHLGVTVQHRSRLARDPSQPNLRQIHLIHGELHDELRAQGFEIAPGAMGKNVTTRGLMLLALPRGTRLHLGNKAVAEVMGVRNPCKQLDGIEPGLMEAVLGIDGHGRRIRKAGIMAVVLRGGVARPGVPSLPNIPRRPASGSSRCDDAPSPRTHATGGADSSCGRKPVQHARDGEVSGCYVGDVRVRL